MIRGQKWVIDLYTLHVFFYFTFHITFISPLCCCSVYANQCESDSSLEKPVSLDMTENPRFAKPKQSSSPPPSPKPKWQVGSISACSHEHAIITRYIHQFAQQVSRFHEKECEFESVLSVPRV